MQKKIQELLKKFEEDHEIYVSAQDAQTFWMVNARIPRKEESHHRSENMFQDQTKKEISSFFRTMNVRMLM